MSSPVRHPPAGFLLRLLATAIDALFLSAVTWPLLFAFYGGQYFRPAFEPGAGYTIHGAADIVVSFVLPPVALLAFWTWRAATPGKMLLGLRIVDERSGGPPSFLQGIVRFVGYFLSAIPLGLGFAWIGFDDAKRGLHDKLARTRVVNRRAAAQVAPQPPGDERGEPAPSSTAPAEAVPAPARLTLFRAGATVLLLGAAAEGVHRLVHKAHMMPAHRNETAIALQEAGLLTPAVDDVLFFVRTFSILLAAAIGLLLVWRAARRPEARALALLLGFYSFGAGTFGHMGVDAAIRQFANGLSSWLSLAALLRFTAVFPRRLTRVELDSRLAPFWLSPTFPWLAAALIGARGLIVPERLQSALVLPVATIVIVALVQPLRMLRLNARLAGAAERARSLWIVYGLLLALGTPLALGLVGMSLAFWIVFAGELSTVTGPELLAPRTVGFIVATVLSFVSPAIMIVAVSVAVLYRGAIDAGLAIRRTTVYGMMGVLILACFSLVEYLLSTRISAFIRLPDVVSGVLAAVLSAGVVGAFRHRLRGNTNRLWDRLLASGDRAESGGRIVALAAELVIPDDAGSLTPREALGLASALSRAAARVGAERASIESLGDAVVLRFADHEAALAAAGDLERRFALEAEAAGLRPVALATGMHAADVGDDDGVAVARRAAALARNAASAARAGVAAGGG